MSGDDNIWWKSLEVVMANIPMFAIYCLMMIAIGMAQEFTDKTSWTTVSQAFAASFLAIPAHLSVLSSLNPYEAMKGLQQRDPKSFISFVIRAFGMGIVAAIPMIIVAAIFIFKGYDKSVAVGAAALCLIVSAAAVFAKWGTMLPAIALQQDKTVSAAGERGRRTFLYAFQGCFCRSACYPSYRSAS